MTAQVDAVYLDLSKAFDTVPHNELLLKLWSHGIVGDLWCWFQTYLTTRTQLVNVNGHFSTPMKVKSGVPQGSILGPLLFLVFVNDMPGRTKTSSIFLFADDTKLLKLVYSLSDSLLFQEDLDSVNDWCYENHMKFNVHKSFVISFGSKFSTRYVLNDDDLPTVSTHKDLGVYFTNNLNWSPHYSYLITSAYKTLALIHRHFCHLTSVFAETTISNVNKIKVNLLFPGLEAIYVERYY